MQQYNKPLRHQSIQPLMVEEMSPDLIGIADGLVPEAHVKLVGREEADHRDQGADADDLEGREKST